MERPRVDRRFSEPNVHLTCRCGWDGYDDDIERWDIDAERDRVVRVCPSCEEPVPEWGTIRPIEGAVQIARGSLRESLAAAGYTSE